MKTALKNLLKTLAAWLLPCLMTLGVLLASEALFHRHPGLTLGLWALLILGAIGGCTLLVVAALLQDLAGLRRFLVLMKREGPEPVSRADPAPFNPPANPPASDAKRAAAVRAAIGELEAQADALAAIRKAGL